MILERILSQMPLNELDEGDAYREFSGKRGNITISHYVFHRETRHHEGKSYTNILPYYDCSLSIDERDGRWWVMCWHGGNGYPQYLPWSYESAQAACAAMLTISDALLEE